MRRRRKIVMINSTFINCFLLKIGNFWISLPLSMPVVKDASDRGNPFLLVPQILSVAHLEEFISLSSLINGDKILVFCKFRKITRYYPDTSLPFSDLQKNSSTGVFGAANHESDLHFDVWVIHLNKDIPRKFQCL